MCSRSSQRRTAALGLLLLGACGGRSSEDAATSSPGGSGGRGGRGGTNGTAAPVEAGAAGEIGAAGSAGDGAGGATEAGTERPPAPPWEPHFDLGTPGWRSSREPLCTERFGRMSSAVWSDGEAVFALVIASGCGPAAPDAPCGGAGLSLYANRGEGWARFYGRDWAPPDTALSGFAGGDLLLYRDQCGITLVGRDGTSRCSWSWLDDDDEFLTHVFTAGTAAYAAVEDRVLVYEEPDWRDLARIGIPFASGSVWADDTTILVGAREAFVARGDDSGAFEVLDGAPAGDYTSVWGFGSEIWLGGSAGQLVRFDGESWERIETGLGEPIAALWGSPGGTLYFIGARAFGRWSAGALEHFAARPPALPPDVDPPVRFTGLWGNGENEVFISAVDASLQGHECSGVFMLHFDGSELHRF